MKDRIRALCGLFPVGILIASAVSCNKIPSEESSDQGTLRWNFTGSIPTRSITEVPDTDAFILTVKDASDKILYEGYYGKSPSSLLVDPGSYTVKAVSRIFSAPEFSAPQYGDEQVAVVQSGSDTRVRLSCSQLNSGLRLRFPSDFLTTYPSGYMTVTSDGGSLKYMSGESRIGYFLPGPVTISLNDGNTSQNLVNRYLDPCEILTMGISFPSSPEAEDPVSGSGISIRIDTTRSWNSDSYTVGSSDGAAQGSTRQSAYSVSQAKEHAGEKDVWVCGYIVGGDLSSSKNGISFTPPFESASNVALAARASVTDKSLCISVQILKGDVREALNLVSNASLLGTKVYLKGDIVASYFGIPGLQNVSEYHISR